MGKKRAKKKVIVTDISREEVNKEARILAMPPPPAPKQVEEEGIRTLPTPPKSNKGFFSLFRKSEDSFELEKQREKNIDEKLQHMKEKDFVLNKKAEELRLGVAEANIQLHVLNQRRKTIEEREKMIEEGEAELAQRKRFHEQEYQNLKLQITRLNDTKIKMEEQYLKKKQDYDDMMRDYDEKMSSMKGNERILARMQQEILVAVQDMEKTKSLLEKNEKEILQKVKDLQLEKQMLIEKEREVVKSIRELESIEKRVAPIKKKLDEREHDVKEKESDLQKREKEIIKGEKELQAKLDRIKANKELRMNVMAVKRSLDTMKKEHKKLESKLLHGKNVISNVAEFSQKEQDLEERRLALLERENALEIREKEQSGVPGPATFARQEPKIVTAKKTEYFDSKESNSEELVKLIEQAKQLIKRKHLSEARYQLYKIHTLFEKMSLDHEQRSTIYYEILDLKNSIELEELR